MKVASNAEELANSRLVPQLGMMLRALWASPVRNMLLFLSAAVFLVVAATAYGQIRLNSWNQPFYDALSHRELAHFLEQLGVFALIAGALLVLNVAQRWLAETLKLKLRQGLAHDLIRNWLQPGRAFRLANTGAMGLNPDQRMHEDARHLTELSADLGIGRGDVRVAGPQEAHALALDVRERRVDCAGGHLVVQVDPRVGHVVPRPVVAVEAGEGGRGLGGLDLVDVRLDLLQRLF